MDNETGDNELTCDHCGSKLMKSRDWALSGYPYWLRPWGGSIKMSELIIPFACIECGRVVYMLRDIHKLKRDFAKLNDEEKKRAYSRM